MASITEVARLAGVSTATASRVVSSADYPVSEATRARVLDAARALDYVPNALARGLLKSQIPVVALTGHALAGHEEGARNAGCDSFVTKPCIPADLEAEIRRVLTAKPGARGR